MPLTLCMTRAVSGINAILKVITRRNTYIPRMYVKIMSSSHEVKTLLHDVKIYFSISNHIVQDAQIILYKMHKVNI